MPCERCTAVFRGAWNKKLCPACETTHKRCPGCQVVKERDEFSPARKSEPDGRLQPRCASCIPARGRITACPHCGDEFQVGRTGGRAPIVLCPRCRGTHKGCARCQRVLPLDSFNASAGKRDGRVAHCRDCVRQKYAEHEQEYRRERNYGKYGLTTEEWEALNDAQDGCCAICRQRPNGGRFDVLYTDHDHETGLVRKLLCCNCNRGLGNFQDNPEFLIAAAAYLREHGK